MSDNPIERAEPEKSFEEAMQDYPPQLDALYDAQRRAYDHEKWFKSQKRNPDKYRRGVHPLQRKP